MFGFLRSLVPAAPAPDTSRHIHQPVTRATRARMGRRPPSFIDLLPWMDYEPDTMDFILEDGRSRAALFELIPTPTEGRSPAFLQRQGEAIQAVLNGAFPEVERGHWVLQLFVQDDSDIEAVLAQLEAYIAPEIRRTPFTQDYLARMRAHLANVAREQGYFNDTLSGTRFRAKLRRTRACLYRRYPPHHDFAADGLNAHEQLRNVAERFQSALTQAGIQATRCDRAHLYAWLLPWFNPRPALTEGTRLLDAAPYREEGPDSPFGYEFCEQLFLGMPESDGEQGLWYFNGLPHQALTLQALKEPPTVGHLTAERKLNDGRFYALFDKLPEGAILSMAITFRAQDKVREHIDRIKRAATGDMPEAELARHNATQVSHRMARGDKVLPVDIKLYLAGRDEEDLRQQVNTANSLLLPAGFKFIDRQADLLGLDAYLRGLPMAFDPALDERELRRSRFMFASHLAALLPLYGRARGTGRPCWCFFNRGGELLLIDPLSRHDRKKNAHLLVLGPTGAGKSATGVSLCSFTLAVHRPRFFIIDAGNSFGLFGEHCRRLGLTVNQVTLNPESDVSLPPFGEAYRMLDDATASKKPLSIEPDDDAEPDAKASPESEDKAEDAGDERKRDRLGEMEIAARIMITGGDPREDAKLSRADRFLIRRAIFAGAKAAREAGKPMMLTEDVANALAAISREHDLPPARQLRASEMADAMRLFCDGLAGHFFNRPGKSWPDADVTILEMGVLAREGNEDQLTIAYISFINEIHALAELRQYESRASVVVTDEAHIVTTNPMLSPYVVKISKMWRKLGVWLWLLTQNLTDFPDQAKRMLNMLEWWLLLTMPKEEVEQLERFRELSAETRRMLLSATKQEGAYTEGVLLSDHTECLLRSVPPSLFLALAMTEKHEKAERAALMREHGISELDAAYRVAQMLDERRSRA